MAAATTVQSDYDKRECPDGHSWRVVGYHHGPRAGVDCDRPMRVGCRWCDASTTWACSTSRGSRCRPCSARYRRRIRSIAWSGMSREGGYTYLLTVTAPGDDAHCKRGGCRGRGDGLGCKHERCACTPVGGVDLAEWNASHSKRWNHLRTRLKRLHPDLEYFRGVEVQDGKRGGSSRGALHDHALVWSSTPLDVRTLRTSAIAAGFGHSVDLAEVQLGTKKAAYYVSKYVTKSADSREDVPWAADAVDVATGEVTRVSVPGRYRTWTQSRGWGRSMAQVRAAAGEYAALKQSERDDEMLMRALGLVGGVVVAPDPDLPRQEAEP